jgi:hypothetical protein
MLRIENKVVARFRDGKMVKGVTHDFNPNKDTFHVTQTGGEKGLLEIQISLLKAVFFVKTFEGNQDYEEQKFTKEGLKGLPGLKVKVRFLDGEVLYGTTTGYAPERKGFFLQPADKGGNNDRLFVVNESTADVATWR